VAGHGVWGLVYKDLSVSGMASCQCAGVGCGELSVEGVSIRSTHTFRVFQTLVLVLRSSCGGMEFLHYLVHVSFDALYCSG